MLPPPQPNFLTTYYIAVLLCVCRAGMDNEDQKAVTAVLAETKGLGSTSGMPGTQVLDETVKQGMTLIDRFCAQPPEFLRA